MRWMVRTTLAVALALGLLFAGATASRADEGYGHHGSGHGGWHGGRHGGWHGGWHGTYWGPRIAIGVGPLGFGTGFWWGGPGYRWGYAAAPYPYPSYGYPYYAAPPAVVVQRPPVYIERPEPPQSYWYYCPSAKGYYPAVPSCPEPWLKVLPDAE